MSVELALHHVDQELGGRPNIQELALRFLQLGSEVTLTENQSIEAIVYLSREDGQRTYRKFPQSEDDEPLLLTYDNEAVQLEVTSETVPMVELIDSMVDIVDVLELQADDQQFYIYYEYSYDGKIGNFEEVINSLPRENILREDVETLQGGDEMKVITYYYDDREFVINEWGMVEPLEIVLGEAQNVMYDLTQHMRDHTKKSQ